MQTDEITDPFLKMDNVTVTIGGKTILHNLSLSIASQQQWAIVGPSGSGKTSLAKVFCSQIFFRGDLTVALPKANGRIEMVSQQHRFRNLSNTNSFYYQQRYNSQDAEDSLTVEAVLGIKDLNNRWVQLLQLTPLLKEPLIQLSNGENKRLQLAKALLTDPAVLILDNPFIGLDAATRVLLNEVLQEVCDAGLQLILMTGPGELPACITHVAVLMDGKFISTGRKESYIDNMPALPAPVVFNYDALIKKLPAPIPHSFHEIIRMTAVNVSYAGKAILDNINWLVQPGECWNLAGPNGAGKSTLLSLITADNPQAYANDIILFDQRRGTGESIWDIKKKIGYVSPELHLYFEQQITCSEVISSGFFDTIGLFRRLSATQEEQVELWIDTFQLNPFKEKPLFQLSTSQQRITLLARALIKNPPLLILDEPTQGLDQQQTAHFSSMVNAICSHFHTTLIYVSHYSNELPACIDHYLSLDKGKQVSAS